MSIPCRYFKKIVSIALLVCSFAFAKATDSISVYIFLSETCPICQNQTLTLRNLYDEYATKGITFIGLFPNQELSSEESIRKFSRKYKIDFALKKDEGQKFVKQFAATITPEVLVVRNADQQILYRGKLDNGFEGIGRKRQVITEHYLKAALDNILNGKPVALKETKAVGCFIIMPD